MTLPLSQLPAEMLREIKAHQWLALMIFAVVSFAVLLAGFLWPYKYESQVIIFVDDRNIIRPLMEGSAVTTRVSDRTSAANELLWSRNIVEPVAMDPEIYGEGAPSISPEVLESRIAVIRANLFVRPRGDSYFSIGYASESPTEAFQVAQRLGQLFIAENNARKRSESRNAYEFIDKQVKSYEQQLAEVEERLKLFLSENVDGTEGEANQRMANLRSQIERAELERQELESRAASLERELMGLAPVIQQRAVDQYQQRINGLTEKLDNLRLRYHDTYPDIVILREQIAELERRRERELAAGGATVSSSGGSAEANPVFQEVRSALAETRADIRTKDTRIRALNTLLSEQMLRMERIQENKTEYAELTRDMEVNKQIYDDLLRRRERARVSMHLDVEGQGLNYRISENAQYPRGVKGPKFSTFAFAGLFLGAIAPFGLIAGLLQIDPRVRARKQLEETIGLPVLAELPPVRTPYEQRRERRLTALVVACALLVCGAYLAIAAASLMGVIG